MTGLDDIPRTSSPGEVQCTDVITAVNLKASAVKTDNVENGDLFPNLDAETAPPNDGWLNEERLQSSSSESAGASSNSGETTSEMSSPDSCTRMEDDASVDGRSMDPCFDGWNMETVDGERRIVFRPDILRCRSRSYCTKPVVTFLASFIEVKCPAANGSREDFSIQMRLDDIINIESKWTGMVQMGQVKIRAISEGAIDAEGNHDFSEVVELDFVVKEACWYEKQEAIQSLDVRYNAKWTSKIDTDMDEYEETIDQKDVQFPTDKLFPEFEPFEDFIYPEGDSDAVSISKRDVDLLEPDTFLNDTIIDFYIKYLKDKIQPEKRQKYHFFNSFFFRKLADLEKYPSGTFDGRAAFLRVRKWTRKVNLFEKDFVFIPVNHNYHWSLIVICHPGEVPNFRDENVKNLDRVPCILHMDSIRGTHGDLKHRIQSYLWEEWKEKHKETSEDISSKFSNLRFVSLELPQQQNSYDCGLFLLHYVESFLMEDPVNINPFKIRHNFLTVKWFPTNEPSLKRGQIWRLIHDLLKRHSRESSPANDSNNCCPSKSLKTENAIESFSPSKACNGNLLCTQAEKGIPMTLFPASLGGSHCASNSGVVVRDIFEPGSAAGALLDMQFQPFDRSTSFNEFRSAMASMQENAETCGNFAYTTSTENGLQNLAGMTSDACDYPGPSRDFKAQVSWNQEMSICQTTVEDLDSSPVTSICNSDKALEVQVVGKCEAFEVRAVEKAEAATEANLDNGTSQVLAETNEGLIDCFPSAPGEMLQVSDSRGSNQSLEPNDSSDPTPTLTKSVPEVSDPGDGMDRHRSRTCDDGNNLELDSDMQHAAKKLRLTPSSEGEVTNHVAEDLCL